MSPALDTRQSAVIADMLDHHDGVDDLGNTPLMTPRYASLTADLIVLGADPNAEDLDGQPVLHAHLGSSENLRNRGTMCSRSSSRTARTRTSW